MQYISYLRKIHKTYLTAAKVQSILYTNSTVKNPFGTVSNSLPVNLKLYITTATNFFKTLKAQIMLVHYCIAIK